MLKPIPQTGATDNRVEPSSPPHDRGHADDPEHVAGDTAVYISAVSGSAGISAARPDKLTLDDVHAFQVHLVSTGISWYRLDKPSAPCVSSTASRSAGAVPERIPYAREPRKLPIVLSADEVVRFLEAVSSLKSRAAPTAMRRDCGPRRSRGQSRMSTAAVASFWCVTAGARRTAT